MPECRSCGAPILWVKTESGKLMPLDPDLDPKAPMILVERPDNGEILAIHRSKVVDFMDDDEAGLWPGRTSHFQTCPNADEHRRRR